MRNATFALLVILACGTALRAQTNSQASGDASSVPLTVSKTTPLRVALENEITVKKIGQPIEGRIVEPVYAFDQIEVPIGSEVLGTITRIDKVSKGRRIEALLNADFAPPRDIAIEFNELVLPNGTHLPLQTLVSPGTSDVVHLVATHEKESDKKNVAAKSLQEARRQFEQEWKKGASQIKAAGKIHRLEEYLVGELPYHPQHIPAGTRYNAELQQPLEFGREPFSADTMSLAGTPPPPGSLAHALLVTPLSSATSKKDSPVEAVLSQPLFSADHKLILPQGARLEGVVLQAQPARQLKRNGELRIVFRKLELPGGKQNAVEAGIEGVEVGRGDNVQLDSEGGAHSISPKTRYLSTGISLALAATSALPDFDAGPHGVSVTANDTGGRAIAGGTGYRVIGIALSVLVHSRPFSMSLGAYGGALSVYTHFLSRGQDVVFPRDTPMDLSFGEPRGQSQKAPSAGD